MTTVDWYDLGGHRQCMEHLREMRAAAEQERLARQVRQPRQLRRSLGELLIAAGHALTGQRPEPCAELGTPPSPLVARERG